MQFPRVVARCLWPEAILLRREATRLVLQLFFARKEWLHQGFWEESVLCYSKVSFVLQFSYFLFGYTKLYQRNANMQTSVYYQIVKERGLTPPTQPSTSLLSIYNPLPLSRYNSLFRDSPEIQNKPGNRIPLLCHE